MMVTPPNSGDGYQLAQPMPITPIARYDHTGRSISLTDTPPRAKAVLFTGAPGMGKSVELDRTERMARQQGWMVYRVDASSRDPIEHRFGRTVGDDLQRLRKEHGFWRLRKLRQTLRELTGKLKGSNTSGELRIGMMPVQAAVRHQRDSSETESTVSLPQLAERLG